MSSASFLHALCGIQERGAVNCSCLRFLAREKTLKFAKIQCENAKKNFALTRNTSHVSCFYCLLLFHISFEGASDLKIVWSFLLFPGLVFVLSQVSSFLCMLSAIQNVLWCKRYTILNKS